MSFAPPSEGAQLQPDGSADPTANFFSVLLTLFPLGTAQLQPPQAQDSSSVSAEAISQQPAGLDPSLVSTEAISQQPAGLDPSLVASADTTTVDPPALPAEPHKTEQVVLLSFLSSLLWATPPTATAVEGAGKTSAGEGQGTDRGAGAIAAPLILGINPDADGGTAQAEKMFVNFVSQQPTSLSSIDESAPVRFPEREAALRVYDAFDQPGENKGLSEVVTKLGEAKSATNLSTTVFPASSIPADSSKVPAANATQPSILLEESAGAATVVPFSTSARPALLAPSQPRETVVAVKGKQESALSPVQQDGSGALFPLNGSKQTEQFLLDIKPKEKTTEVDHPLSQALTNARPAMAATPDHISSSVVSSPSGSQLNRDLFENWQAVVNQVSEGIATKMQDASHEARLQLDPPELGHIDIRLVVAGEHVQAHIIAESKDVTTLIQSHLPELKQALQNHRLDLDSIRVDVQAGGGNPYSSAQQFGQEARSDGQRPYSNIGREEETEEAVSAAPLQAQGRISVWA
jgi:flagellar hook-length control protein FliK